MLSDRELMELDRPNLELMSHFEGPIVDAFYEVALHSWYNQLTPPLPCISTPYQPPLDAHGNPRYLFQDHNPYFDDIEILKAARLLLRRQTADLDLDSGRERFRDTVRKVVDQQRTAFGEWKPGEALELRAQDAIKELREFRDRFAMGMGNMGLGSGSRGPSRSGSRAPSRRASANDTTLKGLRESLMSQLRLGKENLIATELDAETAALTAQNAAINGGSAPNSAHPASIDVPVKSKTTPIPSSDDSANGHSHVMFAPLETTNLDGTGRFFDDGDHAVPKSSPVDSEPRGRSKPIFLDVSGHHHANGSGMIESPASASRERSPLSRTSTGLKNERGEPIPATAQMPHEMVTLPNNEVSEKSTPINQGEEEEKHTKHVRILSEPVRRESVIPEGQGGTKRLHTLSKRFSKSRSSVYGC